jgi:hypothetical protein
MMAPEESSSKELIGRIDELVHKTESAPDPFARELAVDLVQAVMSLHAAALTRILEIASEHGATTVAAIASDDLVSSILALHGLHPDDTETRVRRATDKLRRFFDSRGASIVLLGIDAEVVRVRFTAARPGSGAVAKQMIEDAIYEAAPEIKTLMIEGVDEPRATGFVPLSDLAAAPPL